MSAARYTPIAGPLGTQTLSLTGATALLSAGVTIPPGAVQCTVQGASDGIFGYREDGSEGEAPADCLTASTLTVGNRAAIAQLVLCDNGGAASVVVQFYTGDTGPGIPGSP